MGEIAELLILYNNPKNHSKDLAFYAAKIVDILNKRINKQKSNEIIKTI